MGRYRVASGKQHNKKIYTSHEIKNEKINNMLIKMAHYLAGVALKSPFLFMHL